MSNKARMTVSLEIASNLLDYVYNDSIEDDSLSSADQDMLLDALALIDRLLDQLKKGENVNGQQTAIVVAPAHPQYH
jgi:hypothetical protein